MRSILIAGLLAVQGVFAQSLVEPSRVTPWLQGSFKANPVEQQLRCEVTPAEPILDFSFRFQSGYSVSVPMEQYLGPKHSWVIVTRVTPAEGKPGYLAARVRLPDVPPNKVKVDTFGGFLVGPGRYRVEWAMFDDSGRVCRKDWNIEAKLKRSERNVKLDIPPGAVSDFSARGLTRQVRSRDDAAPFRLTILLHAAPVSPRRTHLRMNDRLLLISTLGSLAATVPAASVRLAVFNLDQQRVLYNQEEFTLDSIGRVSEILNQLELDTIDYHALQNPTGHVDLLSDLINRELAASKHSDAVVFLGPVSRFIDKIPPSALDENAAKLSFFYFQYQASPLLGMGGMRGMRGGIREPMLPDSITNLIARVKGRLIHINSPADFANAISQVQRVATSRNSQPNE
jgi:hypothetical protein